MSLAARPTIAAAALEDETSTIARDVPQRGELHNEVKRRKTILGWSELAMVLLVRRRNRTTTTTTTTSVEVHLGIMERTDGQIDRWWTLLRI